MSLYRLDASIRVEGSHSRAIADIVEQEWRNAHPGERREAEGQARRHGRELGTPVATAPPKAA